MARCNRARNLLDLLETRSNGVQKQAFSRICPPRFFFSTSNSTKRRSVIGLAISSLYQKLDRMGFQSGQGTQFTCFTGTKVQILTQKPAPQEFITAIREAEASGAALILGDRHASFFFCFFFFPPPPILRRCAALIVGDRNAFSFLTF
jgi:hypothetical protein